MRTDTSFFRCFIPGKRFSFFVFGSILVSALLVSCEEKPDFVGKEFLPSGDDFTVLFDSTEVIYGYTRTADSIPSLSKQYYLLGSTVDPTFGVSDAEILSTIAPSINSRGFGQNAYADSVILYLALSERIGEGTLPIGISLYESTQYFPYDTAFYSNMDMTGKYRETRLGTASIAEGDTTVQIRISEPEFINKFLTAHDSMLRYSENLRKLMNGFYLRASQAFDEGGMVRIDFDDTQTYLYFYYGNDSVVGQKQYYSLESADNSRLNLFRHDHDGYPLGAFLQDGSNDDSLLFIQSMAGVNPVIRFPELTRWLDSMPVAINEAKLILKVADTGLVEQNSTYFPSRLNMYLILEDSRYNYTYDYLVDAENVGGEYDKAEGTYAFTIKVHLQSLLEDKVSNLQMIILPGNSAQTLTRAVLYGWGPDPGKRIRLEITYTPL